MKQVSVLILLFELMLMGGCSAPSPFSGTWRTASLPAYMRTTGAEVMDLQLRNNGTFKAELKSRKEGTLETLTGIWSQNSQMVIQFRVDEPATYTIGTGMLMGENKLLCVGTQASIQFYKLK